MTDLDHDQGAHLQQMIDGYQVAQAISVAATLGIADQLTAGPRSSEELAQVTGAHPPSLLRLLRALATVGVFVEKEGGRFALTPLAEWLRTDTPGSLRTSAIQGGQPSMWAAWAQLRHSVTTGEAAFRHVHGMSAWEYRERHPAAGALFDAAMTASAQQVAASIVSAYSFADAGLVVDVGGGQGALIAAVLTANPNARGVLFDQRHVVNGAEQLLDAAGVADRCAIVAGNFFQAIPAEGDLYILKGIIHDWNDDFAIDILANCRRVMDPQSRLLLVEQVMPIDRAAEQFTHFMDLHMLTIHGASERTSDDFAGLFTAADLRLTQIIPTETGLSLIEAAPVSHDSPRSAHGPGDGR